MIDRPEVGTPSHLDDHVQLAVAVDAVGNFVKDLADGSGIPHADVDLALRGIPDVVRGTLDEWARAKVSSEAQLRASLGQLRQRVERLTLLLSALAGALVAVIVSILVK